jgi:hypothetical protein
MAALVDRLYDLIPASPGHTIGIAIVRSRGISSGGMRSKPSSSFPNISVIFVARTSLPFFDETRSASSNELCANLVTQLGQTLVAKGLPTRPYTQINERPIVKASPFQVAITQRKTQRFNDMKPCLKTYCSSGGIPGIPVNRGCVENNVQ